MKVGQSTGVPQNECKVRVDDHKPKDLSARRSACVSDKMTQIRNFVKAE